jgi:hypothetical protein
MIISTPIASLSLDLDNQWSYLKIHGDSGWETFPSYLDIFVPRVLEFLAKRNLLITFFVVGQDAALEKNYRSIQAISDADHEIGNHSFSHEPWLHLYDRERLKAEIVRAEEQILAVTGQRPVGFRGPGFSFSEVAIDVLESRGYVYDASTFPTFFGPLARFYYVLHSNLAGEDLNDRKLLFGSLREGLRPLAPYRWRGRDSLLEIPVSTLPVLRSPIHLSYILFLSKFSPTLALSYFRAALRLCRLTGLSPSLLLHPLDFLGVDDNVGLQFFPAMQLRSDQKIKVVSEALRVYCSEYHVVPMLAHANAAKERLQPQFSAATAPSGETEQ